MKKFFKSVMLFAAAAMAFTACSDNDELESVVTPGEEAGELKLVATAEFENETRAEFEGGNGGQMVFTEGDLFDLKYWPDGSQWVNYAEMRYNAEKNCFTSFQTIRPIKVGSEIAVTPKETIPTVQTNTYNNGYFNLNLLSFTVDPVTFNSSMQQGDQVSLALNFKHVASYMQIRFVTEDPAIAGKAIKSVRFEAPGAAQIADDYGNLSSDNFVSTNFDGLANQPVVVNKTDAKNYNNVAYLAVVPQAYTNAKFVVTTMTGENYTVDVPAKTFERAHVHRIVLNLKAAAPSTGAVFTRMTATNINQLLQNGAEFIMVGFHDKTRYLSKDIQYSRFVCKKYAAPVSGDLTLDQIGDARIFQFELAEDGKNWYVKSENRYTGKKSSYLQFLDGVAASNDSFKVTVSDTEGARLQHKGSNEQYISLDKSSMKAKITGRNVDLDIYVKVTK